MLKIHMLESLLPVDTDQGDNISVLGGLSRQNSRIRDQQQHQQHSLNACYPLSYSTFDPSMCDFGFGQNLPETRSLPGDTIRTISGSVEQSADTNGNLVQFVRTWSRRYTR